MHTAIYIMLGCGGGAWLAPEYAAWAAVARERAEWRGWRREDRRKGRGVVEKAGPDPDHRPAWRCW